MYFGVDYYPEHWPEERWETDAQLMKKAGFNVVRLAEFAWVKMEPMEGVYDFAWLDRAIDVFHKYKIDVILGTPTASMPRWAAIKYPETVAAKKNGEKIPYGARKDNCPTSQSYRLLSQRITQTMAEHYSENPAIIGWQTDNELGGPNCYCRTCEGAWQDWLAAKFKNIEDLNARWGTVFWSHTYRNFSEIPLPVRGWDNPSMALDYARFHSEQVVSFHQEQIDIIRNICPQHFVTHNLMGFFDNLNYYDLSENLDFVSWDYYYNFRRPHRERMREYVEGAAAHDLMRSLKHKYFWVMETTAGPTGNKVFGRNVRPKELRRLNFQSVAHGANGIVWFRWRTCRFGFEQYWHGLLGHDGQANRRYQEAAQVAHEFRRIQDEIEPSQVKAKVAIALSYDDRWAFKIQPHSSQFDYVQHLMEYYKALASRGIDVDYVNLNRDDLSKYKLIIAPTLHIITPEITDKLEAFVNKGGSLVLTFRSGVKNVDNVCHELMLPGYLRNMAGIRIEEYEGLNEGTRYQVIVADKLGWGEFSCSVLADWIIPEKAHAIANYKENGLEDYAAATVNEFGKGRVYYIGTWFQEEEFYKRLMDHILKSIELEPLVMPSDNVEVSTRYNGDIPYIFILNHNEAEVEVEVPKGTELLSKQEVEGLFRIPAGEVAIIKALK